ncbi:hypothetical protein EVAR_87117_1 [Eumeta japonica]|uniref:Uncharacterized protein n=1 Tax=Eumeta variegata TaxID=151549 RepID=A0A4C2A2F7_EUMVA|nr:hypothetical protein EVAR_87117_1 [Eumeta japonica]
MDTWDSDLTPSDLYLFPKLKEYLKGQRFEDDETVVAAVQEFSDMFSAPNKILTVEYWYQIFQFPGLEKFVNFLHLQRTHLCRSERPTSDAMRRSRRCGSRCSGLHLNSLRLGRPSED